MHWTLYHKSCEYERVIVVYTTSSFYNFECYSLGFRYVSIFTRDKKACQLFVFELYLDLFVTLYQLDRAIFHTWSLFAGEILWNSNIGAYLVPDAPDVASLMNVMTWWIEQFTVDTIPFYILYISLDVTYFVCPFCLPRCLVSHWIPLAPPILL
jgi:hypothetical protein